MTNENQLHWYNPEWQKEAHAWIRAAAGQNGLQITGEIEQPHAYAWSTVLHVPTNTGKIYFKATALETIFEIALTKLLADLQPDFMPELLAVDTTRGWMLMRDSGEQLRASIRPTQDVKPWTPVIKRYAELQISLADYVSEFLALGVPDHRPESLPALYRQLLTDEASLMIDQEKGLTSTEFDQLQNLTARFEQICGDLSAFGIPDSLNHGDFHDGNVLIKNGRITFFDWGDASVTHPFVSLRTWFVSMEISLKLEEWAPPTPEMTELLNLYLQPWERFAPRDELLKIYALSKPVASIAKALAWHQTISRLSGELRSEYAWIVPEVLREFMIYEKMLSDNS